MIELTPWDGAGAPPSGDVLVSDVFADDWQERTGRFGRVGVTVRGYDPETGTTEQERIAIAIALIAAHPDQSFWLATQHVERAREWLVEYQRKREDGRGRAVIGPDGDWVIRAWPLPNLTLLAPPSDLDALLELPAARHGVVVSSVLEIFKVQRRMTTCVAGHCVDIDGGWLHEPGGCPGAPMNCSGRCCYANPGAVLLGEGSRDSCDLARLCTTAGVPVAQRARR